MLQVLCFFLIVFGAWFVITLFVVRLNNPGWTKSAAYVLLPLLGAFLLIVISVDRFIGLKHLGKCLFYPHE